MRLEKRTYTLPPALLQKFERRLPPGERSSSLAQIMEAWLAEREREELRQLVVEGCQAMKDDYEQIEREWAGAIMADSLRRGDIVRVRLDPVEGSEQGGDRHGLVISPELITISTAPSSWSRPSRLRRSL